ncbi:hypothetical protein U1701_00040 [Sphingomonas sp. PB2P19]|uniref:hypothetical protein n=1 Tax=Sphingomonas rhamnosi TaxID=3096156 RepID=UPI002FCA65A8
MATAVKALKSVSGSSSKALNARFKAAQDAAKEFSENEDASPALLKDAMAALYAFGEDLMGTPDDHQHDAVEDFLATHEVKLNAASRRNNYIPLVQLVFDQRSKSLQSQYAKVLQLARHDREPVKTFGTWLGDGGIKARHSEAVTMFGGTARENNDKERDARIARATAELDKMPVLGTAQLSGDYPTGFVTLLAKVDDDGLATILDVAERHIDSIRPIILRYDPQGAARKAILANRPLGRFWRAVDLVMGITQAKTNGEPRSILITNTMQDDKPVCLVQAVSRAHAYTWASVTIGEHVEGLPLEKSVVLYSSQEQDKTTKKVIYSGEADLFWTGFAEHDGWRIDGMSIVADALTTPVKLFALPDIRGFRVARIDPSTGKETAISYASLRSLQAWIEAQRKARKPARSVKQRKPFPDTLTMEVLGGDLRLTMTNASQFSKAVATNIVLGTAKPDREFEDRELGLKDVEALIRTISAYEVDLEGYFADPSGPDTALYLNADVNGDRLAIVIPTRGGSAVGESCRDLEVAV